MSIVTFGSDKIIHNRYSSHFTVISPYWNREIQVIVYRYVCMNFCLIMRIFTLLSKYFLNDQECRFCLVGLNSNTKIWTACKILYCQLHARWQRLVLVLKSLSMNLQNMIFVNFKWFWKAPTYKWWKIPRQNESWPAETYAQIENVKKIYYT